MDFLNISFVPEMAFFGGSIGAGEWIMLLVVVLVVVGPRRLPEVARKFGRTMEMFRKAADEFKEQLLSMDKEVKDTVGDAAGDVDLSGVEGEEGPDDAYGESYEYDEGAYDDSDYPGNEDLVSDGESESDAGSEDGSDNLETPDQVAASEESSVDAGTAPEEPPDDSARGETGSAEEKA